MSPTRWLAWSKTVSRTSRRSARRRLPAGGVIIRLGLGCRPRELPDRHAGGDRGGVHRPRHPRWGCRSVSAGQPWRPLGLAPGARSRSRHSSSVREHTRKQSQVYRRDPAFGVRHGGTVPEAERRLSTDTVEEPDVSVAAPEGTTRWGKCDRTSCLYWDTDLNYALDPAILTLHATSRTSAC
jgi:hypothetical protein